MSTIQKPKLILRSANDDAKFPKQSSDKSFEENHGQNTAANVIEIEITAKNISLDPFIAASIGDIPSSTFENIQTTIPSSTTKPVARTIANKVNTLMENQKSHIIKKVAINETGISKGLNAMAQSLKNK
jgi:hypothetical protein